MDKQLTDAPELAEKFFRKQGLQYYASGENHDYLADEILLIDRRESDALLAAGDTCYELLRDTARRCLGDPDRMRQLGIPAFAVPHLQWSVDNEWDDFVVGRFDFAGGTDGLPIKLIEFNADTCSLLPETTVIQPEVLRKARVKTLRNDLADALRDNLKRIGKARGGTVGAGGHLGSEDDQLNLEVILRAARAAKWKKIDGLELAQLTFDPEYGLLADLGVGEPLRYPYLFKFFPWDWAADRGARPLGVTGRNEPQQAGPGTESCLDDAAAVQGPAGFRLPG